MEHLIGTHLRRVEDNYLNYGEKYRVDKKDISGSLDRIKEALINEKQENLFDACTFTFFNTLRFPYSDVNKECFEFISSYILHSNNLDDACFFADQFLLRVGMLLYFFAGEGLDAKEAAAKEKNIKAITTLLTKNMSDIFNYIIKHLDTDANSKAYLELFKFVQTNFPEKSLSFLESNGYNCITDFFAEINKRISDIHECEKLYYKNVMKNKSSN